MLPSIDLTQCAMDMPASVMGHVVRVESAFNPYAIGVVGGRLVRQPANLAEAVATARELERLGYNFSVGLAQVNRYNLASNGLGSYAEAFQACRNVQAGARILKECYGRAGGDWGKSFSCYYSGNFQTGYDHGYVQKVFASMGIGMPVQPADAIPLASASPRRALSDAEPAGMDSLLKRRSSPASAGVDPVAADAAYVSSSTMRRQESSDLAPPAPVPAALPADPRDVAAISAPSAGVQGVVRLTAQGPVLPESALAPAATRPGAAPPSAAAGRQAAPVDSAAVARGDGDNAFVF